jgi:hypothetical protein
MLRRGLPVTAAQTAYNGVRIWGSLYWAGSDEGAVPAVVSNTDPVQTT